MPRPPFEGTLKIAYLGNIVPFKGAHVILREVLRLPDPGRAEVHIYGRPVNEAYHEEVTRLALELPEGRVVLHGGYRSDKELQEILSTVHLVVFPSLWEENYPLVVRETLLHGVPVVGSTLGGVPEAIEDGVTGFLFDRSGLHIWDQVVVKDRLRPASDGWAPALLQLDHEWQR